MGEEHIIKTSLDVLLSTLQEAAEPLSTGRLASICGMREREVVKWAHALEKSGKVRIENRFNGAYLSWAAPVEKMPPSVSSTVVYARDSSASSDIHLAREREAEAKAPAPKREKVDIAPESSVDVGDERIERVDRMIGELKQMKEENLIQAARRAKKEENIIDSARRKAVESEETVATEFGEKPIFKPEPLEEGAEEKEEAETWEKEAAEAEEKEGSPKPRVIPSKSVIKPKFRYAGFKPKKIGKIKKPEPVRVTGVSLQFSERLARQMKRIEARRAQSTSCAARRKSSSTTITSPSSTGSNPSLRQYPTA